jgi:hypothetical protein
MGANASDVVGIDQTDATISEAECNHKLLGMCSSLDIRAFVCASSFYFLLRIAPIVQRHLPGTGARRTSRIDQQANSLDGP